MVRTQDMDVTGNAHINFEKIRILHDREKSIINIFVVYRDDNHNSWIYYITNVFMFYPIKIVRNLSHRTHAKISSNRKTNNKYFRDSFHKQIE